MFGFGSLTGKTERRITIRDASGLGDNTGSRLGTTVEFAFDVARSVELLEMLHVDMPKTSVIKEEFLLRRGEVLIDVGHNFHVEDFLEVT